MNGRGDRLRVLLAPDSFKGSLSSVEVARALAEGWARARPDDELILAPLADGGEGLLAAMAEVGGWEWQECPAHDPLGRPLTARWLLSADGTRAAVELAEASGLSRLPDGEPRDPLAATTDGTGEILQAVLDAGVRHVVMGVGGSATTDGGAGLLRALGVWYRGSGWPLPGPIPDLDAVDLAALDPRLGELELRIACDVTNPLLGEQGAAAVYAPAEGRVAGGRGQAGGLADALRRPARGCLRDAGPRTRRVPARPAATSFGLLCLAPRMRSLRAGPRHRGGHAGDRLRRASSSDADLVITGEGQIDAQTAFGKTALGVARRAAAAGVPCLAVGGGVTPEGVAALAEAGALAVPVLDRADDARGGDGQARRRSSPPPASGWRGSIELGTVVGSGGPQESRAPSGATAGATAERVAGRRRPP